jgi:hypothetical protein
VPKRLASGLRGVKQKAKDQIVPFHAPFARQFSILEVRLMIISSGPKGKEAKQGPLVGPADKDKPRELPGSGWIMAQARGARSSWNRPGILGRTG